MPSKFYRRQARFVALTLTAMLSAAAFTGFLSPNVWMWGG